MRLLVLLSACVPIGAGLFLNAAAAVAAHRTAPARLPDRNLSSFHDCDECPDMVLVPGGQFEMGSPANEPGRYDEEGPQRTVHIRAIGVGKYPITRRQWAHFASTTHRVTKTGCAYSALPSNGPHGFNDAATWRTLGFEQDDTHPVVCVTWADAVDYARWLSVRTARHYRLLTEAEWEYAARAGSSTAFPWGSDPSHANANYHADSPCKSTGPCDDHWTYTSPAGSFPPNAFGLFDMSGNVLEWVQDCFFDGYKGQPTDGSAYESDFVISVSGEWSVLNGTRSCSYRRLRGGDWGDPPALIRSAARNFGPPPGGHLQSYRSARVGFRVALSLDH